MGPIDPLPGEVHQVLEVLGGAEGLGLEACHLAGGSGLVVLGAATDHNPQGGIEAEVLGVVDILVPRKTPEHGLAQHADQGMTTVLAGTRIRERFTSEIAQSEGVIEFPIRKQTSIGGDDGAAKLHRHAAIKIDAKNVVLRFTHRVRHVRPARS